MFRAANETKDGGHLLLLGLTPANIRRMRAGEPILVDCADLGLPGVRVSIMFGQTERAIVAELRDAGFDLPSDVDQSVRDVEAEHRRRGTTP